jgi:hypothetical protein
MRRRIRMRRSNGSGSKYLLHCPSMARVVIINFDDNTLAHRK